MTLATIAKWFLFLAMILMVYFVIDSVAKMITRLISKVKASKKNEKQ